MDYLISSDPSAAGAGCTPRGGCPPDATTINGVVINVGNGSPSSSAGNAKKPVKKVRREASFRQLFHSKSTKTSSAGSPFAPANHNANMSPYYGNSNNNAPSPVIPSSGGQTAVKKTFSVASPASSSTANIINAGVVNGETYKSLGDVFGINAAVNNLITEQHVRTGGVGDNKPKLNKNPSLPLNGHLRPTPTGTPTGFTVRNGDTAVYRVNSAAVRTNAHNRNSTYSNVSVGSRFGSQESRASYNGGARGFFDSAGSAGGDPYKSNSSLDLDSEVDIVQQAVAGASFFGANLHPHHDGLRSFEYFGAKEGICIRIQ